jgi:hypothetical protein
MPLGKNTTPWGPVGIGSPANIANFTNSLGPQVHFLSPPHSTRVVDLERTDQEGNNGHFHCPSKKPRGDYR